MHLSMSRWGRYLTISSTNSTGSIKPAGGDSETKAKNVKGEAMRQLDTYLGVASSAMGLDIRSRGTMG